MIPTATHHNKDERMQVSQIPQLTDVYTVFLTDEHIDTGCVPHLQNLHMYKKNLTGVSVPLYMYNTALAKYDMGCPYDLAIWLIVLNIPGCLKVAPLLHSHNV